MATLKLLLAILLLGRASCETKNSGSQPGSPWKQLSEDNKWEQPHEISKDECGITGQSLAHHFTHLSEKVELVGSDGELCTAEESDEVKEMGMANVTCLSCDAIYSFIQQLLVDLDMTTECCLGNDSACSNATDGTRTNAAKAYGYGFLMILGVSLLSLLGVIIVPMLNKRQGLYLYINTLLIAMGTSALFCSALLHLLPKALQFSEDQEKEYMPKGTVIMVGLYLLYLFEVIMHLCNNHSHHHHHGSAESHHSHGPKLSSDPGQTASMHSESQLGHSSINTKSTAKDIESNTAFQREKKANEQSPLIKTTKVHCCHGVKPLAWTIVFGDAIHNFADGLTVGAAISHSLSLGLSTTLAITLHEIPHELGDFAILLSSGLRWPAALLLNFLSSWTAIVGFFVGVTIGTTSEASNHWILTAAVGFFLYVALVDLLPELLHSEEKGWKRCFLILMENIGFFISFTVLFLIALYEDKLDELIHLN